MRRVGSAGLEMHAAPPLEAITQYDERGASPCEPPHWRAAGAAASVRRGARGFALCAPRTAARGAAVRAMRCAALALCCAGRALAARQPQVLSPMLGIFREGTTGTFHTSQPATFTGLQDGNGDSTYTTLERTTTSLTLQAGHAGGGKYTIRARMLTPACVAAPTSLTAGGHNCQYDAEWHVMFAWQAHLLSLFLLLLASALTMAAIRVIRIRCCPQKVYDADDGYEGKRRVRSPSPVPDFALENERQL